MGVIQKQYHRREINTKKIVKRVVCKCNIDIVMSTIGMTDKKLPLTIGKEYDVYEIYKYGINYANNALYAITPDDYFQKNKILRFLKKIFFISEPRPIKVDAKFFNDIDTQYLRNKKLSEILD